MKSVCSICSCLLAASLLLLPGCGNQGDSSETEGSQSSVQISSQSNESTPTKDYSINLDASGKALRGYDAVEYFKNNQPTMGSSDHEFVWKDAKWQFISEENKNAFAAEPEKYAPSNGGYCTFGVVIGKKFDGDPEVWSIQNDQLYIFLNDEVKGKFTLDLDNNLRKVSENWPNIREKSPKELESQ